MRKRMWMIGIAGILTLSGCGEPARPTVSAVDCVYSSEMTGEQMFGTKIVENTASFVQTCEETATNDNAPENPAGQAGGPVPQEPPKEPDQETVIAEKEGNTIPSEAGETAITEEPYRQADSETEQYQSSTPAADTSAESGEIQGAPEEEAKPVETAPAESIPEITQPPVSEPQAPKTAYDYGFDINAIAADCIEIGKSMGLTHVSSLTPQNAAYWNPVTASESNQGAALKQSLESYIRFHTLENLSTYGLDEIHDFNIYCEPGENGTYTIYFLFA